MRFSLALVFVLVLANCGAPDLPADSGNLDTAHVDAGSDADTDCNIDAKCVNTPVRCAIDPECCADTGSEVPDGHYLGKPVAIDIPFRAIQADLGSETATQ